MEDAQVPLARPAAPAPPFLEPPSLWCGPCCLLRRAFCCLSLRTGTIVIALTQVVLCLLHLFLEALYLAGVLHVGHYAYYDELTGTLPESEARWGTMDVAFASLSGLWLIIELITLGFSLLLLKGALKEMSGLVRVWLYFKLVNLIFGIVVWLPQLGVEFHYRAASGGILLARGFVPICVSLYMLIVVRSFWFYLKTEGPDTGFEFRPPPPLSNEKYPGGSPGTILRAGGSGARTPPPEYKEENELLTRADTAPAPTRLPAASFPPTPQPDSDEEEDESEEEEETERGRMRRLEEEQRAREPNDADEMVRPRATWGARVLPPLPPDHRLSRTRDISPPRPPPPVVVALHPDTPPPPTIPVTAAPFSYSSASRPPTAL